MIKVALVNSEGEVVTIVSPSMDDMYIDGSSYADLVAVHIPHRTNTNDALNKWYRKDGAWVKTKPARPSDLHYWENEAWHINTEQLLVALRQSRDAKLSWSDHTQLADAPITDAKKAEWSTYRQALRQLPETYASVISLDDIIWPTKPEV